MPKLPIPMPVPEPFPSPVPLPLPVPRLPKYVCDLIDRMPDWVPGKQGCPSTGRGELGERDTQAKDDLGTLSRFKNMTGENQLVFLMRKVSEFMPYDENKSWLEKLDNWTEELAKPDRERGLWAERLRGMVGVMKLDYLFELEDKTVSGNRRRFMNEDLREFLNLNEHGTIGYFWNDIHNEDGTLKKGWDEALSIGAAYHQYDVPKEIRKLRRYNAKFLRKDGREAIFNYMQQRVDTPKDRATFNYVPFEMPFSDKKPLYIIAPGTAVIDSAGTFYRHNLYDVDPWKELMREAFEEFLKDDFDFDKDAHNTDSNRYFKPMLWIKNSEIWSLYPIR
jgi:hypothetical protein